MLFLRLWTVYNGQLNKVNVLGLKICKYVFNVFNYTVAHIVKRTPTFILQDMVNHNSDNDKKRNIEKQRHRFCDTKTYYGKVTLISILSFNY